jgi:hypothetical protein
LRAGLAGFWPWGQTVLEDLKGQAFLGKTGLILDFHSFKKRKFRVLALLEDY